MQPRRTGTYFSSILENDPGGVYYNIECARTFCPNKQYQGLSGIHISVILREDDILTLLLKHELFFQTKLPLSGRNKATGQFFRLPPGQDALFLAIALGHFDIAAHIARYAHAARENRFFRLENADGRSHLEVLAMLQPTQEVRRFYYEVYQILVKEIRPNPLHANALFMSLSSQAYELIYVLYESLKTPQQKMAFYCAVTDQIEGKGIFYFAGKQEQNRRVAHQLARQAVAFLKMSATGQKWLQKFWQLGSQYAELKGSGMTLSIGQWVI